MRIFVNKNRQNSINFFFYLSNFEKNSHPQLVDVVGGVKMSTRLTHTDDTAIILLFLPDFWKPALAARHAVGGRARGDSVAPPNSFPPPPDAGKWGGSRERTTAAATTVINGNRPPPCRLSVVFFYIHNNIKIII